MMHAMSFRLVSSSVLVVALASFAMMGCSKDKTDDGDAAADAAAADATVADAAADAADAAAVVDAAAAPLATTAAPVTKPKAPPVLADPPICQKARAARQRNSPSFPALEAQCKAAGGTL